MMQIKNIVERAVSPNIYIDVLVFSSIFILLSRVSDQCAIRARLGVAGHLSNTPK